MLDACKTKGLWTEMVGENATEKGKRRRTEKGKVGMDWVKSTSQKMFQINPFNVTKYSTPTLQELCRETSVI